MFSSALITLFFSFIAATIIVIIILFLKNTSLKKSHKKLTDENNFLKIRIENLSMLESEKQKFEEKNKKLWTMSETVHKERKLVDEANEKLSLEKEKLEAEKKKLDEKVKKLWSLKLWTDSSFVKQVS